MSRPTKGPWYVINDNVDATDCTVIASEKRESDGRNFIPMSPYEVLGMSEWLRVKPADLRLMALSPELLNALKAALPLLRPHESIAESNVVALINELITKADGT